MEAKALAEEIGLPGELWRIQTAIGELRAERGDADGARRAFLAASEVTHALARKIADRNLRESFLSAPQVRRVLELR